MELLERDCIDFQFQKDKLQGFKNDYEELHLVLEDLPQKLQQTIMVPFSSIAFLPGFVYHTNEITVLLGENYFVKRSCVQAQNIINRRLQYLENSMEQLSQQIQVLRNKISICERIDNKTQQRKDLIVEIRESYQSDDDLKEAPPADEITNMRSNKPHFDQLLRKQSTEEQDLKYETRLLELERLEAAENKESDPNFSQAKKIVNPAQIYEEYFKQTTESVVSIDPTSREGGLGGFTGTIIEHFDPVQSKTTPIQPKKASLFKQMRKDK